MASGSRPDTEPPVSDFEAGWRLLVYKVAALSLKWPTGYGV